MNAILLTWAQIIGVPLSPVICLMLTELKCQLNVYFSVFKCSV